MINPEGWIINIAIKLCMEMALKKVLNSCYLNIKLDVKKDVSKEKPQIYSILMFYKRGWEKIHDIQNINIFINKAQFQLSLGNMFPYLAYLKGLT